MKRFLPVAFLLALPFAPAAGAQSTDPELVAEQYFKAVSEGGFRAGVPFFHQDTLTDLRDALLSVLEAEATKGGGDLRAAMFGASMGLDQIGTLPASDFATGYFSFVDLQMRSAGIRIDPVRAIGVVYEGADIAHVVARGYGAVAGADVVAVDTVTLTRDDVRWAIMPSGDVTALVGAWRDQILSSGPR